MMTPRSTGDHIRGERADWAAPASLQLVFVTRGYGLESAVTGPEVSRNGDHDAKL